MRISAYGYETVIKCFCYGVNYKLSRQRYNDSNNKITAFTVLVISSLLLLCLLGAFGKFGSAISSFLTGIFGLSSYAILLMIELCSLAVLFGRRVTASAMTVVKYISLFAVIILVFHIATSKEYLSQGYFNYLISCYDSGNTAGGLLSGLITYFPSRYLTFVVSMILFTALFFLLAFSSVFREMSKSGHFKTRKVDLSRKNSAQLIEFDEKTNVGRTSVGRELFVTTPKERSKILNPKKQLEVEYDILYPRIPDDKKEEPSGGFDDTFTKSRSVDRRQAARDALFSFQTSYNSNDYGTVSDDRNSASKTAFGQSVQKEDTQKEKFDLDSLLRYKPSTEIYTNNYYKEQLNNRKAAAEKKEEEPNPPKKPMSYSEKFGILFGGNVEKEEKEDIISENVIKNDFSNNSRDTFVNEEKPVNRESIIGNESQNPVFREKPAEVQNIQSFERRDSSVNTPIFGMSARENERKIDDKPGITAYPDNTASVKESKPSIQTPKYIPTTPAVNEPPKSAAEPSSLFAEKKQIKSKPPISGQLQMGDKETLAPIKRAPYKAPPIELLKNYKSDNSQEDEDFQSKVAILENTMANFGINAQVKGIVRGPACTRFELAMPAGISVKKITNLESDIAMNLEAVSVRIEAPIPGKNLVGVEIPNKHRDTIGFKSVLEADNSEFFTKESPVTFAVGLDIDGRSQLCDLSKMPHLIIAGTTGSGKSVCINTLIASLIYKSSPEDVRLILIDPKRVELSIYNGLPHLLVREIITESKKAVNALGWAIQEMETRFKLFQAAQVNSINNYNAKVNGTEHPKLPYIVIIIDEVADLMMTVRAEIEDKIMRLSALARAAGIHLVFATQRPSVDVITGTIKNNLPSRIAFAVSSSADSKTILGVGGAESLLGNGDMLYHPVGLRDPKRLQGAFISQKEVSDIVNYVIANNDAIFDDDIAKAINHEDEEEKEVSSSVSGNGDEYDMLLPQALKLAIESKSASISMLQRRFPIGYSRAAKIIDQMDARGYVSKYNGSKPRDVLITMEEFKNLYPDYSDDYDSLMDQFGGDGE